LIDRGADASGKAEVPQEGRHGPRGPDLAFGDDIELRGRYPWPHCLLEDREGARDNLPGRVHALNLLGRFDLDRRFFPQPHVSSLRLQRYPPQRSTATATMSAAADGRASAHVRLQRGERAPGDLFYGPGSVDPDQDALVRVELDQ